MATFISLHIKSGNRIRITELLQELSEIIEIAQGPYPKELNSNILLDDASGPTFMAVGHTDNGWTAVHLNSFKKLHDWAEAIAKALNTTVIQIIGQTVSDVYYFLMYEKGLLRREIEVYHGDMENLTDRGEKFRFERTSLVPVSDEDYENLFDRDTLEAYCKEIGFDLFSEVEPEFYYILRRPELGKTIKEYAATFTPKKPWWKFW